MSNSVSSDLSSNIQRFTNLLSDLKHAKNLSEKISLLDHYDDAKNRFIRLKKNLKKSSKKTEYILKAVCAIGQGDLLFASIENLEESQTQLTALVDALTEIEQCYDSIGGIVGYHLTVLKLIKERSQVQPLPKNIKYLHPIGFDITQDRPEVRRSIREGILSLPKMAEIYPVGGAGDRLDLRNSKGEPLPAAELRFAGRSLLEALVRDLQAKEYLFYKLTGRQVTVPIAMMTSHEKNNHQHVLEICASHKWFGRPKQSYSFFTQPLVPMVTTEGNWVVQSALQLTLKPGGHGLIWKLAIDNGIIDNLIAHGHHYALIRQINNLVAGTDYGLYAFLGLGIQHHKKFGFASCPRIVNAAEGMNVLIETRNSDYKYKISNIEYVDFEHYGLKDHPAEPGSSYSTFPANTNILFVDLRALKPVVKEHPIPGMLINTKNLTACLDKNGHACTVPAGRLESTMQNIADFIEDVLPASVKKPEELSTYITYNQRRKTISVTKKSYKNGDGVLETPEGCFYEMLQNSHELFSKHCKMELPAQESLEEYLQAGPSLMILYNPALGPFFSIISQKIRGGKLAKGSEIQIEATDVDLEALELSGSLLIIADNVLGSKNDKNEFQYNEATGKCRLHHVVIENKGIDRHATKSYWKNQLKRQEACKIILHGNAEFIAENVVLKGNFEINVPDGHLMTASMNDGVVVFRTEKLKKPTWRWAYKFDQDDRITINREQLSLN